MYGHYCHVYISPRDKSYRFLNRISSTKTISIVVIKTSVNTWFFHGNPFGILIPSSNTLRSPRVFDPPHKTLLFGYEFTVWMTTSQERGLVLYLSRGTPKPISGYTRNRTMVLVDGSPNLSQYTCSRSPLSDRLDTRTTPGTFVGTLN